MEIATSHLESEKASVASFSAISHDLLLGGAYPYGGNDNKAGEMGDEMPSSNCKGTAHM